MAILYDTHKSDDPQSFLEKHKSWYQTPYNTLTTGKGVCSDYALLKSALLLAVKGEQWHKNNTSIIILNETHDENDSSHIGKHDLNRHMVLLAEADGITYTLNNFGNIPDTASPSKAAKYIEFYIKDLYPAACEIGDFDKDKLNHSEQDDQIYFQISTRHYPDGTYQSSAKKLSVTTDEKKYLVRATRAEPSFCSGPETSNLLETIERLRPMKTTYEEVKTLDTIETLSMESNKLYIVYQEQLKKRSGKRKKAYTKTHSPQI